MPIAVRWASESLRRPLPLPPPPPPPRGVKSCNVANRTRWRLRSNQVSSSESHRSAICRRLSENVASPVSRDLPPNSMLRLAISACLCSFSRRFSSSSTSPCSRSSVLFPASPPCHPASTPPGDKGWAFVQNRLPRNREDLRFPSALQWPVTLHPATTSG